MYLTGLALPHRHHIKFHCISSGTSKHHTSTSLINFTFYLEMVRQVICEPKFEGYLTSLGQSYKLSIGLIIGQVRTSHSCAIEPDVEKISL